MELLFSASESSLCCGQISEVAENLFVEPLVSIPVGSMFVAQQCLY
jgi:hypothetical protein